MISRILIPILLAILLSDIYIDRRYLCRYFRLKWQMRLLWWIPSVLMLTATVVLSCARNFAPADATILNKYLLVLAIVVIPKLLFMLCSVAGWGMQRLFHTKRNYGNIAGFFLAAAEIFILIWGATAGFQKLDVRHADFYSASLPEAFDGYRIVHFSDAHVGTYDMSREYLLRNAIACINAQKADLIVFTGDIQNITPDEIYPHAAALSMLNAPDGVVSVLGNHDYANYIDASDSLKAANCDETVRIQEQAMMWKLLRNESIVVRRGSDSIVVAGMENWGTMKPEHRRGDIAKTLHGVSQDDFVIMLQHDPSAWDALIMKNRLRPQLTLSGHTHAMQFMLFGWSPASLIYDEWGGMYYKDGCAINVSTGLGGFIPFRFGVPGEIVVITLHRKK